MAASNLAVTGRSSRWNDAMLAFTQPARSVTRARAGPASDRIPVSASTSSSAWAVSSSKSGWRVPYRYESARGSLRPTRVATRSAKSQATGSVTALLLWVLQADDLLQVQNPQPDDQQHHRHDDEPRDPIGLDLGREHVHIS